jgi:hypothetical protein
MSLYSLPVVACDWRVDPNPKSAAIGYISYGEHTVNDASNHIGAATASELGGINLFLPLRSPLALFLTFPYLPSTFLSPFHYFNGAGQLGYNPGKLFEITIAQCTYASFSRICILRNQYLDVQGFFPFTFAFFE